MAEYHMREHRFSMSAVLKDLYAAEMKRRASFDDQNRTMHEAIAPVVPEDFTLVADLKISLPFGMTPEETALVAPIIERAWNDMYFGILRTCTEQRAGK